MVGHDEIYSYKYRPGDARSVFADSIPVYNDNTWSIRVSACIKLVETIAYSLETKNLRSKFTDGNNYTSNYDELLLNITYIIFTYTGMLISKYYLTYII